LTAAAAGCTSARRRRGSAPRPWCRPTPSSGSRWRRSRAGRRCPRARAPRTTPRPCSCTAPAPAASARRTDDEMGVVLSHLRLLVHDQSCGQNKLERLSSRAYVRMRAVVSFVASVMRKCFRVVCATVSCFNRPCCFSEFGHPASCRSETIFAKSLKCWISNPFESVILSKESTGHSSHLERIANSTLHVFVVPYGTLQTGV
jgi:hypothetical protein